MERQELRNLQLSIELNSFFERETNRREWQQAIMEPARRLELYFLLSLTLERFDYVF